jgi:heat shock protein HslJ
MIHNKLYLLVLMTSMMAINGCSTFRSTTQDAQPEMLAGKWAMTRWKDQVELKTAFPAGVPSFSIDSEKGTISGFTGCNQMNGMVRHDPLQASLQFYALVATRMFCNSVPELELTTALSRINKYSVSTNKLTLMENSEVVMEFERVLGGD